MTKICVITDFEMNTVTWNWVPEPYREWLGDAYRKHVFSGLDPEALSDVSFRIDNYKLITPHVAKAIQNGERIVRWVGMETAQYMRVVEWIAEIDKRDPRVARAIPRMSFGQALDHSERWHAQMLRQSERMLEQARRIKSEAGTPTVLTLGGAWAGWRWVWLKTDEARDDESSAMRHCVGDGSYDHPDDDEGCFSLRDKHNAPHVTIDLLGFEVEQAQGRGNDDVAAKYQPLVDRASHVIGLRLLINQDPTKVVADGIQTIEGGSEYHVSNGMLHRTDGPAVIHANGVTERWVDGMRSYDGYPSIAHNWQQEFLKEGKRHRDDGPAVIGDGVRAWYCAGELLRTEFEDTADVVLGSIYRFGVLGSVSGRNNLARLTSGHDEDGNPVHLIEGLNYVVDFPARTFLLKSMPDAPVPGPLVIVTEQDGKPDLMRDFAEANAAASVAALRGNMSGLDGFRPRLEAYPELAARWNEWSLPTLTMPLDDGNLIVGGVERDRADRPVLHGVYQIEGWGGTISAEPDQATITIDAAALRAAAQSRQQQPFYRQLEAADPRRRRQNRRA